MKRAFLFLIFLTAQPAVAQLQSYDIFVTDKARVQRSTMGGPTSRMIAVGHPGGSNFAFDAINCRPVYAWYGGYLDFRGELTGRGGRGAKPLGVKRYLGTQVTPFHTGNPGQLPEHVDFQGYRRDAKTGTPTFLFAVDGLAVEQRLTFPAPETIQMEFSFPDPGGVTAYYHLDSKIHKSVELSKGLRWFSSNVIGIPASVKEATITIKLKPTSKSFVRKMPNLTGAQAFGLYCAPCHSSDGSKLAGPSFKGLWGREQIITRNGKSETVQVDETYLLESILKPQAAVVKGYETVPMADFSVMLTKDQISKIIGHLKTLK